MSMNDNADEFFHSLGPEHDESIVERKGRHYAEGEARFATVAALAELAKNVTTLSQAQATAAQTMLELTKDFKTASADVATLKVWMEGSVTPGGTREPGIIDHIATFKRWKNWVLGLLTAIFTAQVVGVVLGFFNHAQVAGLK